MVIRHFSFNEQRRKLQICIFVFLTAITNIPSAQELDPKIITALEESGYNWGQSGFIRAIQNKDYQVVDLYAQAGIKILPYNFLSVFSLPYERELDRIIESYNLIDSDKGCPTDNLSYYTEVREGSILASRLKNVCGTDNVISIIEGNLNKYREAIKQNNSDLHNHNKSLVTKRNNCVSYFKKLGWQETASQAATINIFKSPENEKEQVLFSLNSEILMGLKSVDDIWRIVITDCNNYYVDSPLIPITESKISSFNYALRLLSE